MAETYAGEFYCVKCKEKREAEGDVVISESGRRMAKATCPVCGTKLNRILGLALLLALHAVELACIRLSHGALPRCPCTGPGNRRPAARTCWCNNARATSTVVLKTPTARGIVQDAPCADG